MLFLFDNKPINIIPKHMPRNAPINNQIKYSIYFSFLFAVPAYISIPQSSIKPQFGHVAWQFKVMCVPQPKHLTILPATFLPPFWGMPKCFLVSISLLYFLFVMFCAKIPSIPGSYNSILFTLITYTIHNPISSNSLLILGFSSSGKLSQ